MQPAMHRHLAGIKNSPRHDLRVDGCRMGYGERSGKCSLEVMGKI